MKRFFITLSVAALTGLPDIPLQAQTVIFKNQGAQATLVELYSSEGCSSCPPAEAWVSTLKEAPGLWTSLFPVVFHVDYWDGLGWPDRFAKAAYTQRQRNYAAQLGQDSVYTPEFVVGGREWHGWLDGERQPPASVPTLGELSLRVERGGGQVSASYATAGDSPIRGGTLNVALLGVGISSRVERGENGGRELRHDFVVLDFKSEAWPGGPRPESGPIALQAATGDPPGAIVAWISRGDGSIVQVAGGWLNGKSALANR
jgi:hypothetical protein